MNANTTKIMKLVALASVTIGNHSASTSTSNVTSAVDSSGVRGAPVHLPEGGVQPTLRGSCRRTRARRHYDLWMSAPLTTANRLMRLMTTGDEPVARSQMSASGARDCASSAGGSANTATSATSR